MQQASDLLLDVNCCCDCTHSHADDARSSLRAGHAPHLRAEGGSAPLCHAQYQPQAPPQGQVDPLRDVAHQREPITKQPCNLMS